MEECLESFCDSDIWMRLSTVQLESRKWGIGYTIKEFYITV